MSAAAKFRLAIFDLIANVNYAIGSASLRRRTLPLHAVQQPRPSLFDVERS